MGEQSKIEWCDATFNAWWGCVKVSPGCEHCYAETLSKRYGHTVWGPAKTTPRRTMSDAYWNQPRIWNRKAQQAGTRLRVFCASMADVFEDHPIAQRERERLWDLIAQTPMLTWMLLTKRPEHITAMLPPAWHTSPQPNVWLGTSCEDQRRADERIPHLLAVPAVIHWLSCEPLLGPVVLGRALHRGALVANRRIAWVIAGGESGAQARPLDLAWARRLRDECQAAGVAFHFKQVGGRTHAAGGRLLDGREWSEVPSGAG